MSEQISRALVVSCTACGAAIGEKCHYIGFTMAISKPHKRRMRDADRHIVSPTPPKSVEENVALPPIPKRREESWSSYRQRALDERTAQAQHWKNEAESLRQATLTEALRAVENERLEKHRKLVKMEFINQADISDAAYSRAIHDAENAIKALLTPSPKSEPMETI
jgi:hypothetical protein